MATKLTDKYLQGFIGEQEYQGVAEQVKAAHAALHNGTGLGNDFIGWLTPTCLSLSASAVPTSAPVPQSNF